MKKKFSLVLAATLSLSLILAACGGNSQNEGSGAGKDAGQEGKTYTFKMAHITQPTHIWHKTSEKFNEEVSARSNGRIKVETFPAGQLGPEKDMIQQLETGTIDFAIITNALMSTRAEEFNAWFMPYLLSDIDSAVAARNSEPAKKLLAGLDKQGLVGMDYIMAGNRHVLMKNTSVTNPDDLKNKKIRIIGSPSIQDFWKAVGSAPTPMPLPEVYTALQTGVIDGVDIDLDALMTEKYYEIAKNFTITNHMPWPGVVMMNKAKFDGLSPEDQKIVSEAMKAAVEYGSKESIAMEKKNLEDLKSKGATVTELTNTESFAKIRDDIYTKYSSNAMIKEFIEANKK
ncbi:MULTISPECIES: TRAP transporter substrate-binding protein [unclassified Paenibacillus]|uniref:TRAP transporter substrate-binding protein n=1 Tax=unclassified Paenibacillus TaxID=185978 RepID=UPI001AE3C8DE|nr:MULTISPECIES: TRAP transporter substrate-binding protein [unclassified Paenibacillus]MBP1154077.1 tripartite ATP-independent transporter DctP family solute receptor [Paenibacillus sp. PvP091]MBP1170538.1 tripartite ATP-independent transporter DctP family solute receptor [Paenibacillus sp. PvR098]MBP2441566.1 tripartite ATP-independent transporter DctP family solute receptor [Paenibacillus sp. PvP052]